MKSYFASLIGISIFALSFLYSSQLNAQSVVNNNGTSKKFTAIYVPVYKDKTDNKLKYRFSSLTKVTDEEGKPQFSEEDIRKLYSLYEYIPQTYNRKRLTIEQAKQLVTNQKGK